MCAREGKNDMTVIRREQQGAIVTLTIDDPATRNALSPALFDGIEAACHDINRDMSVSCVILTGTDPAFCAGGNIKEMYERTGEFGGNPAELRRRYTHGVQRVPHALYNLEVPIIAAVNGFAIGAGMDFATMCTIRIASERAVFAESFIALGMISGDGGAWFLQRAIGVAAAAELTLTGDRFDAARALELRYVSRVVAHDELLATARGIAERIVCHPPQSIRLNNRLLRESARLDLPAALELASAFQTTAQHTDDHVEAVAAMMEKRAPRYTGR